MYGKTITTLIDIISNEFSPKETIEFINTLVSEMQVSPSHFIVEFKNARYDYGLSQGLCPFCGDSNEPKIDKAYEDTDSDGNRSRLNTYKTCKSCGEEY